jgi:replicative DNA helicase
MSDLDTEELDFLKSPPYSLEAEQAVLGGLMLENDAWDGVAEKLMDRDFYQKSHKQIFSIMYQLVEGEKPIDWLTLSNELERLDELDEVGGQAYLAELANNTPSTANILDYADIVRERSVIRQLLSEVSSISERAYHPEGASSDEILDDAERRILAIAESRPNQGGPEHIKPILRQTLDDLEALVNRGGDITGITTGFTELDKMTSGMQRSDLLIVAARPSMGKTTFAMNLVENALIKGNAPCLVFSLEMPSEQLVMRMMASLGSINQTEVRTGKMDEEGWAKLTTAVTMLNDKPLFIDDTSGITPNEMKARARRVHKEVQDQGGLGLIMVDYLQLMRVPGFENNRTQEISEISRSLKALAKELNCPVVALAQLNRSLEQRPNKRPVNSDLRESGAIEQDADVIMFIYRDAVYNEESPPEQAEIIIGKQRNGPIGSMPIKFEGHYSRFTDALPDEYEAWAQEE